MTNSTPSWPVADGPSARLPDWLVVAQETWGDVERRNHLIVRALAERHPRARFLFAELPLRPRGLAQARLPRPQPITANIWRMRALRPFPERFPRLDRINDRFEAMQLRRALRALAIERPALWTQDPRAAALLVHLPPERLVYDLTDDWAAFEQDPQRRAVVEGRIRDLAERAELILACSRPLEREARTWASRVEYVPNAVAEVTIPTLPPADISTLPRPVLGYAGTLHSARLDVELLAGAAELRSRWSFVLLGPDQLDPTDARRLGSLRNVHRLGVRPQGEVRAYLEAFDICLFPHLITDFTRSLDPLKLYEYLAAGRPVIATETGNVPDLSAHLTYVTSPGELVAQAERALAEETPQRAAVRRAAVADATWQARARQIEAALRVEPRAPSQRGQVSVVVVSYNTRELLERCLGALQAQNGIQTQVVVVDNASTDGSPEMVRERFADVELLALDHNAGFARANNLAFPRCTGEFVLLLNSDAFLAPGALAQLLAAARRHPCAGAVGPRLLNPDGSLQRSAWPFPHAGRLLLEAVLLHRPLRRVGLLEDLGAWPHDEERRVDFLVGACLLLRAEALAEVGGFDERFWLYGEEADLQRRLSARGWEVVFTPAARATHVGAASSKGSVTRLRHFYAGQRRFLVKHEGPLSWPAARLALLLGSLLRGRWSNVRVALERRR